MITVLPDHILRLMAPDDRATLGAAGVTAAEAGEKWQAGEERKMHDQFSAWLRLNDLPFITSRFDMRATIRKGWPDFTVIRKSRVALVEFKAPGGALSEEQKAVKAELDASGTPVLVAFSVTDAIQFTRDMLL